jgi:Flp pilus assembly pilin Flp
MAQSSTPPTRHATITLARTKRRVRGVVMVEYIFLLAFVVVPIVGAAVLFSDQFFRWYLAFVDTVSLPVP